MPSTTYGHLRARLLAEWADLESTGYEVRHDGIARSQAVLTAPGRWPELAAG